MVILSPSTPDRLEFFVCQDYLASFPGLVQKRQPALYLLVKTDDGGRDVVGRESIQARQQTVRRRLFLPLQNRQMIRIENDGQGLLAPALAAADLSS